MSKNKFILFHCPFCGAEPEEHDHSDCDSKFKSWISCPICYAQAPKTFSLYEASLAWNKRVGDGYESF